MNTTGIADAAKNLGVVVTTASGAAYACGYLVVRARARALGTDPGFTLVDQAYVFAGFRFVLVLLLALLLVAPFVFAVRALARLARQWLSAGLLRVLAIMIATLAGIATVLAYTATIGVNGALLAPAADWATDAVLERNEYGLAIVLGTTALTACVLPWAISRLTRAGVQNPFGLFLLAIALPLAILLPVQHGVFQADRSARLLDKAPEGLTGPVWLVDRGAGDRIVLYGRSASGRPMLVTLKAEKLDGIGIVSVTTLGAMVREGSR